MTWLMVKIYLTGQKSRKWKKEKEIIIQQNVCWITSTSKITII